MLERCAYSYRDDPAVPAFPDTGPVFFVDGACGLCSRWARLIARLDRAGEARICPVQSPTGQAVLRHYGLDPDDPESWLYLEAGRAFTSMEGIAAAGRRLGGWLAWVAPFLVLPPKPVQDWLYARIARNRYRLLGRTELCALPDPVLRARLIQ
ncbi:MAG: DUF393 domain-containing protein [Pseudomonadota bacterium]